MPEKPWNIFCSITMDWVFGSTSVNDESFPFLSVSFSVCSWLFDPERVTEGKNSLLDIFRSSLETLIFSLSAFSSGLLLYACSSASDKS